MQRQGFSNVGFSNVGHCLNLFRISRQRKLSMQSIMVQLICILLLIVSHFTFHGLPHNKTTYQIFAFRFYTHTKHHFNASSSVNGLQICKFSGNSNIKPVPAEVHVETGCQYVYLLLVSQQRIPAGVALPACTFSLVAVHIIQAFSSLQLCSWSFRGQCASFYSIQFSDMYYKLQYNGL